MDLEKLKDFIPAALALQMAESRMLLALLQATLREVDVNEIDGVSISEWLE